MEQEIKYYETIQEKEEKCSEMVGHNTMRMEWEEKKAQKEE
tara:strand:+ start:241 stop:363 length:123 start_codon:yes stop_codon:yes gene_type:complete